MRTLEQIVVVLDSTRWSAVSRVALGMVMLAAIRSLIGDSGQIWIFVICFFGGLIALRLVPAILRRVLPWSDEARTIWAKRRFIAKEYDSYQWQKLFWIGLGFLPYAVVGDGFQMNELVLSLSCLICGGLGVMVWLRSKDPLPVI